ncbi:ArsR family transcriptional regulator [Actinoplanes sp. SE50]|uniref:ArsR/SmtB family transcription factor n=1 Tax=unclassified Actinoplanes TaxID=2626549 RepID=UPI00023ECFFC|nr:MULTISPECIES: metalloregulator ArsR/SmtB family transcription factor [unclassified Actinoplanes]AEV82725.1 ArsR family transcriptional regulator [Actinoplanes sp. SE50/110]ATO81121.1 ArsR family transcriptional regulator [Actinoplanes sp. SE50]SLL98528.1 transcriptional regulator [Actinoplanes sp. SE50/110]
MSMEQTVITAVPRPAGGLGIEFDDAILIEGPGLAAAPLEAPRATAFAAMFKALGDPVRLRLLSMIASAPDGEACVCDLSSAFHLTGPTISHHLRILREAGLVDSDRRGTWVYYRAVPATLILLAGLLQPAS